jgi:hypothetical protein
MNYNEFSPQRGGEIYVGNIALSSDGFHKKLYACWNISALALRMKLAVAESITEDPRHT